MSRVIAIDAGTTGIRVVLVDAEGRRLAGVYEEFNQHYPRPGWVEHDATEIWQVTARCLDRLLGDHDPASIAGIGITNQRETVVLWDERSGEPLARAIVWQCRRTTDRCHALREAGHEELVRQKSGLVLDPYFSGTKIAWLLEHAPGARELVAAGHARVGTIDSWLCWKLSGGRCHVTDPTNASRTMLLDLASTRWDDELCELLGVPRALLPEVVPSSGILGHTDPGLTRGVSIPLAGMAGDQQSALFGQGCVQRGQLKNTYGTGCFAMLNTGEEFVHSRRGLLSTLACGPSGEVAYALEGSVFIAGAVIQWLRDELSIIEHATESEAIARSVPDTGGVYIVPAFTGLGAPYWEPDARGLICGLTRGSGRAHIVRAALESIAYQTRDLLDAFGLDAGSAIRECRVDGGAVANDLLMQFQADILDATIIRPADTECTVMGAAYLAGLATGVWADLDEIMAARPAPTAFSPTMDEQTRTRLYAGWQKAVARTLGKAV